ncbi:hypothetical protein [Alkalilacustris brevis]|uniref:hypothetical protein n=1 Tax=Alkalilacustris brevis TaxID=2026338 RepID=UPI001EE4D4AD|nr:hypothetical protein [Alkalilacustris brevis]
MNQGFPMAYLSQTEFAPALRAQIDRVFTRIGQGFNAYLECLARRDEIEYLNSLSDAELTRRGLTRDQIVQHVFRDKLMF